MNPELQAIVNPELFDIVVELAKNDIVLNSAIKKTESVGTFINALLASVICITDRELAFQELVQHLLESNPQIKEMLAIKKDLGKPGNDQPLLLKEENR